LPPTSLAGGYALRAPDSVSVATPALAIAVLILSPLSLYKGHRARVHAYLRLAIGIRSQYLVVKILSENRIVKLLSRSLYIPTTRTKPTIERKFKYF